MKPERAVSAVINVERAVSPIYGLSGASPERLRTPAAAPGQFGPWNVGIQCLRCSASAPATHPINSPSPPNRATARGTSLPQFLPVYVSKGRHRKRPTAIPASTPMMPPAAAPVDWVQPWDARSRRAESAPVAVERAFQSEEERGGEID